MIDNKAIYIISSLSRQEINKLRHFIGSSYFNRSTKLISLYNELIKFYPDFKNKNLTKEKIYSRISGNTAYNDSTFRALMHDLLDIIYKFLIVENIDTSSLEGNTELIKILINKRLNNVVESEMNKSEKVFENSGKDFGYLYNKYMFESYKYNYLLMNEKVVNRQAVNNKKQQFERSESYLSMMFISEMISDYVNAKVTSDKYNTDSIEFPGRILSAINVEKMLNCITQKDLYLIAKLYNSLYKTYKDFGNTAAYLEYKDILMNNEHELNMDEKSTHYNKLISYCIISNKNGSDTFFVNELFNLYEYILINGYYKSTTIPYLAVSFYRNILLNALRFRKYTWAENFVNIYSEKVSEKQRNNMLNYGLAMFFKYIGKNSESLRHMDMLKLDNFIFKYDMYMLKSKIFYEYDNPIPLFDHLHTFREFMRNDRLLNINYKKKYRNFLDFISILSNYKEGRGGYDLSHIKDKLFRTEHIMDREWLLEQIGYIETAAQPVSAPNVFSMY